MKENKIYTPNNIPGQEDDNNIFIKKHKLKETNVRTNIRYPKPEENIEFVSDSIKYNNLNSDIISSKNNFSNDDQNSFVEMNGSENSFNKEIDHNRKYFDSEKLSAEEIEKDETKLLNKNHESDKKD